MLFCCISFTNTLSQWANKYNLTDLFFIVRLMLIISRFLLHRYTYIEKLIAWWIDVDRHRHRYRHRHKHSQLFYRLWCCIQITYFFLSIIFFIIFHENKWRSESFILIAKKSLVVENTPAYLAVLLLRISEVIYKFSTLHCAKNIFVFLVYVCQTFSNR